MRRVCAVAAWGLAASMLTLTGSVLPASGEVGNVYYSRFPVSPDPTGTLWVAASDGSSDEQLLANAYWPRLSPDGRYLIFLRDGSASNAAFNADIWIRDLETNMDTKIRDNSGDYIVNFDFTPDSKHIVFDYSCSINKINLDGTGETAAVSGTNCYDDEPAISTADGSIAFHNTFAGIMLADANGANRHQVPNTKPNDIEPAWSPDGQWISFRRYSGAATGNALWKIHPDGTGLTPLGAVCGSNTLNTARAWTPDGNYLIAPGTIAGIDGLYAVATDGSGAFLQIEISAGADPEWAGSTTGNISGSPVVSCCGDVNVSASLTASDSLLVLKAAVGSDDCPLLPCICDTNGNGTITASDALAVLRRAVGQGNALECQCN